MTEARDADRLLATLEQARELGFLGPGPVGVHIEHALGFADLIEARDPEPRRILDLGTGGGVPGLVLAERFPAAALVLLEVSARRSAFLEHAVAKLGWSSRIEVVVARGEEAGRRSSLREGFSFVTARGFAEPAVTAEIGAAFVSEGGALLVSEPPQTSERRWSSEHLAELGLGAAGSQVARAAHFVVIEKIAPTPERFPRAVGKPSKRPLW